MRSLVLLPAMVAGIKMERTSQSQMDMMVNVDRMREAFLQIAEQAKANGEGEKISDSVKLIVQGMLDNINGTIIEALWEDHHAAQHLLDISYNATEACYTGRTNNFANIVDPLDSNQSTAEDEFHNCKDLSFLQNSAGAKKNASIPLSEDHDYGYNFSRVWNDESTEDAIAATSHEQHAHDTEFQACKALDDYVKAFDGETRVQNNSLWCETPSPSDWSDRFRTDLDMVTNSHTWFSHMDTFEENHAAEYKRLREECHQARHRHQERIRLCHQKQHAFEHAYCQYANAIDSVCHTYKTCHETTYQSYETTNTSVSDMEVQFKAQQHALECLLCYGNQILQDKTNLTVCDDQPCDKCDDLSITYTEPHSEEPCSEAVSSRPCEDAWCNAHYGPYSGNSDLPIDQCIDCSGATISDWTPPSGHYLHEDYDGPTVESYTR